MITVTKSVQHHQPNRESISDDTRNGKLKGVPKPWKLVKLKRMKREPEQDFEQMELEERDATAKGPGTGSVKTEKPCDPDLQSKASAYINRTEDRIVGWRTRKNRKTLQCQP